jgi:hypothetical protein
VPRTDWQTLCGTPFHAWFMTQEFWMCTQYRIALCNTIFLSTVLNVQYMYLNFKLMRRTLHLHVSTTMYNCVPWTFLS